MKKAIIEIKKLNSNDVVATSGTPVCNGLNNTEYNYLIKSDGDVQSLVPGSCYSLGLTSKFYYDNGSGKFRSSMGTSLTYYGSSQPSLKNGKWYHVKPGSGSGGSVVECKNPDHYNFD